MSTIKGWIQRENVQRKSYDVDTGDIAGVRKHPGLTGQHINLATNTAYSYLLCTRASPGTKEALPQTALQVLDIFITLLLASILSNKRGPLLVCHLWDKAKPRQMNSSACDCLKCEGERIYSFHTSSWHNSTDTTNVPFSETETRGETDAPLWQSRGHQMYEENSILISTSLYFWHCNQ